MQKLGFSVKVGQDTGGKDGIDTREYKKFTRESFGNALIFKINRI